MRELQKCHEIRVREKRQLAIGDTQIHCLVLNEGKRPRYVCSMVHFLAGKHPKLVQLDHTLLRSGVGRAFQGIQQIDSPLSVDIRIILCDPSYPYI